MNTYAVLCYEYDSAYAPTLFYIAIVNADSIGQASGIIIDSLGNAPDTVKVVKLNIRNDLGVLFEKFI